MPTLKRYDIKKLLANPDLRRRLIVESTRVTQAREGIEVARDQVENSYYVVTEAEQAAFFSLVTFRTEVGDADGRHAEFVRALGDRGSVARSNVALRDFANIDGAPLAYDRLGLVGALFREFPKLDPAHADARRGGCTGDDERFVRFWWEQPADRTHFRPFAKGGAFSRFYSDVHLRVAWDSERRTFLGFCGRKGRETERPEALDHYFRPGLTWPLRTQRGFSIRVLPAGCIFGHKGPAVIPKKPAQQAFLNGVLNSALAEYLLKSFVCFGSWEVGAVKKIPVPLPSASAEQPIVVLANRSHDAKAAWDTGNEVCTRFESPWLLQSPVRGEATTLPLALDGVLSLEIALDAELAATYQQLNDAVYRLYGVNEVLRGKIEAAIGERPPEVIWPQMEGKTAEQKRMEHVCRLLTYAVKCVQEEDDDGLVSLQSVAQERPLLERVRTKLASFFPEQDPHTLEIEVVNELKKRVKGCARAESLHDWLTHVFFDFHCDLYQQRPILWHLASSQESAEPALSVIVHYHRFDHDRLAKLRSVHVRDRLGTLRREAAQAGKDGREDDRLQLLAAIEEVEAFDRKLARLQEGHYAGSEGGDDDYRILTPWKKPDDRPKGWRPDLDDGVKVNIAPLARTGLLRTKNKFGAKEPED
jgi:hypothetical protein